MSKASHSNPEKVALHHGAAHHEITHQEAKRRNRLCEHLLALPYPAFEQLTIHLLQHSGYASVHIAGRKHKRGRFENHSQAINDQRMENYGTPGDGPCHGNHPARNEPQAGGVGSGGCDLRAYNHTDLATALTVVQIKQYRRTVSRRFVDELRGTMLRLQATHGLLITTSNFSRVAQRAAEHSELAPIRLLDGDSLLDLLIQHRIGVRTTRKGWRIDRRWLDRLAESATSGGEAGPLSSSDGSSTIDNIKPASYGSLIGKRCSYKSATYATDTNISGRSGMANTATCIHKPANDLTKIHPFNRIGVATRSTNDCLSSAISDDSGGSMLWRTHVLAGVSSLWLLEYIPSTIGPDSISLLVTVAALGSLLPDLDAAESKIKHLSVKGMKPFYLPAQAVHRHFAHRGFSHSLSGLALLAICAAMLGPWWGWSTSLALALGYASHLAADACTRSGIRWLFPSRRRYHLLPPSLRFVTGSQAEEALFPLLALLVLSLLLRQLSLVYSF